MSINNKNIITQTIYLGIPIELGKEPPRDSAEPNSSTVTVFKQCSRKFSMT